MKTFNVLRFSVFWRYKRQWVVAKSSQKSVATNQQLADDSRLQRLQNRAVRVLTNTCYDADANQLLKELGWDNLETRRQKLKAEMVYKSLNGLAPNYLSSKFIQRSDVITAYNLCDSDGKLAIALPRTNYYKNSFGYSGAGSSLE